MGVYPQDGAAVGWTLLVGDGIAGYLTTLTLVGEDLGWMEPPSLVMEDSFQRAVEVNQEHLRLAGRLHAVGTQRREVLRMAEGTRF